MPRPQKPIFIHELQGTVPEHSTLATPQFAAGRPKMPKDLSPVAAAEWKRLVKELTRRGTLTRVDSSALEIYCVMFARWKAVAKEAEEHPMVEHTWVDSNGIEHSKRVENPASKIAGRLENSLRAYQKEFSATPGSREKTRPTQPERKKDEYAEGTMGWYEQQGLLEPTPPPEPEPEAEDFNVEDYPI